MDRIINAFITAYMKGHIFTLTGKATREDFWYFALAHMLLNIAVIVLSLVFVAIEFYYVATALFIVYIIFTLFSLIPAVTLAVRRFHDVGFSGWLFGGLLLGMLVPLFVALYMIYSQAALIAMGYAYGDGLPESVSYMSIIFSIIVSNVCALVNFVILALPPEATNVAQETE